MHTSRASEVKPRRHVQGITDQWLPDLLAGIPKLVESLSFVLPSFEPPPVTLPLSRTVCPVIL